MMKFRGVLLLEIIIGIVILLIFVTPIIMNFSSSNKTSVNSYRDLEMYGAAFELLEQLQSSYKLLKTDRSWNNLEIQDGSKIYYDQPNYKFHISKVVPEVQRKIEIKSILKNGIPRFKIIKIVIIDKKNNPVREIKCVTALKYDE